MNSDIGSSLLTERKLIVMVSDNGGFAVINRLQNLTGGTPFNNFIHDRGPGRWHHPIAER